MEIDFNIQDQISSDIYTIKQLISYNPFETVFDSALQKAIFTEIMICLNDLVQKCKKLNVPVNFTDDIDNISNLKDKNITGLIAYVRDSLCHIDSKKHVFNQQFTFNYVVVRGSGQFIVTPDLELSSKFEDDYCIIFRPSKNLL